MQLVCHFKFLFVCLFYQLKTILFQNRLILQPYQGESNFSRKLKLKTRRLKTKLQSYIVSKHEILESNIKKTCTGPGPIKQNFHYLDHDGMHSLTLCWKILRLCLFHNQTQSSCLFTSSIYTKWNFAKNNVGPNWLTRCFPFITKKSFHRYN